MRKNQHDKILKGEREPKEQYLNTVPKFYPT